MVMVVTMSDSNYVIVVTFLTVSPDTRQDYLLGYAGVES